MWLAVAILLLAVPACTGSETGAGSTEIPENEYGLEVVDDENLCLQTVEEEARDGRRGSGRTRSASRSGETRS